MTAARLDPVRPAFLSARQNPLRRPKANDRMQANAKRLVVRQSDAKMDTNRVSSGRSWVWTYWLELVGKSLNSQIAKAYLAGSDSGVAT